MAEFTDVMGIVKRMCLWFEKNYNHHPCEECPARLGLDGCGGFDCSLDICNLTDNGIDFAVIEQGILEWDKQHPGPRYPTWEEWHKTTFPDAANGDDFCPTIFLPHGCREGGSCDECFSKPIPADIAEKLGIKPLEDNP